MKMGVESQVYLTKLAKVLSNAWSGMYSEIKLSSYGGAETFSKLLGFVTGLISIVESNPDIVLIYDKRESNNLTTKL